MQRTKVFKQKIPPPPNSIKGYALQMPSTKLPPASVRFATLDSGVVEVSYAGLITDATYAPLVGQAIRALADAPSAVIRYDRAMILMEFVREVPASAAGTPPAAIIVLPEQMGFWRGYSRKLADLGLMRAVFLVSEAAEAYRWAEVMAATHCPRQTPVDSDFGSLR